MPTSRCNVVGVRLLLGLALVITTLLSLTPQPPALPDVSFADKWAHAATYVILAALVDFSWPTRAFGGRKWLWLLAYGLLIEIFQAGIPARHFSVADLAANAAGIGLYALAAAWIRSCRTRPDRA